MILILLAALFGAAQEEITVFENAQTHQNVDFHPGSSYLWEVVTGFNPVVNATSDDFSFVSDSTAPEVDILWKNSGRFYLLLTETNAQGCTNKKALSVLVLPNDHSIGFETVTASACFNETGNSFIQKVIANDNQGVPLESALYPLNVEFTVNGFSHSRQLNFDDQNLEISDEWFTVSSNQNTVVDVKITKVTDNSGIPVQIRNTDANLAFTIFGIPEIQFDASTPDTIQLNSYYTFRVTPDSGYSYEWWITDEFGGRFNFNSNSFSTENHFWDVKGIFEVFVQATNESGCHSEIISKSFVVNDTLDYWQYATAGKDTTIGSCNPYVLLGWTSDKLQLHYSWQPADLIDDPTSPHPVFTPGETTVFTLTVSDENGYSDIFSVKITVSDVVAEAGEDVFMYNNSTAVLDGSASTGIDLQYFWSTQDGHILNGAETMNPEVNGFGTYYLEVTDRFGCSSIDSVKVGMLTHAPVAKDDYDSTAYQTEIKIPVLDNDSDPENDIDSLSLYIKSPPINGTAYVDYSDFTIHYRPNNKFSGNDSFEYQICDTFLNCSKATVYVMVSDFRFFIPDAFSPNGDGINDYFEILGIEWYEGNSIEIFNRWGNKVYQAKNYGISSNPKFWDGKSNTGFRMGNEGLPSGTYFYILDLGNGEKRIAGSVYLDR